MKLLLLGGAGYIGSHTAVELLTGLVVNRDYQVWDYRDQPGNLLGQICPRFTALWVPVGMAAMGMYRLVDGGLDKLMPASAAKYTHG